MASPLTLRVPRSGPGQTSRHVRTNVRLLDDVLSEAIRYLDGEDAATLVEGARKAASEGGDAPHLDFLFSAVKPDEAMLLARAFACHSMLANIGEDVAGRRREAESEGLQGAARTVAGALEALDLKADALDALNVVPVLTAHPTEVRRRALVDREAEISRLMALRRHSLPPDLDARIRESLFREVALLWRTRLHRPEKITVADEIRNALSIVRTSMLPALVELYETWSERITDGGDVPSMLRLGSWLGGDRDGHPGVTGETMRLALKSQSRVILDFYAGEVRKLWSDLAISDAYEGATDALKALATAAHDPSPHRFDEPYRLALEYVFDRLSATAQRLAGQPVSYALGPSGEPPYDAPDAFVADLETVRNSLIQHGGARLIGARLNTLLQVARACGFHMLALDMRQNADVHERLVAELIQQSGQEVDYLSLSEDEKVALLLGEMAHQRPLRSPFAQYSEETTRELDTLEAAAEAVKLYGPKVFGAYVVSKTATLSDMLEPLVLLAQVGLMRGGAEPTATVRVSPLLETIEDLEHGPDILGQWLDLPLAKAILGEKPIQEVMVGYSDSNKDGGYVASRRGVARAATALARTCDARGVGLQIFHGRGGSVGRGGGPAAEAVLAQPPHTVQGRLRMTEQGEMIARRYGDQPTARRNLESLVAAVLTSTRQEPDPEPSDASKAAMDALAAGSFGAYRKLVYETPGFTDFFWAATPISEIVQLNIGSRPASRTASRRIEDLRAIPWVFSWSQARFMLPGWFGFAGGVERAGLSVQQLSDLSVAYDFFAALLSNMELALAQSDMGIAARYAKLAADVEGGQAIMDAIRAEHDRAVELALAIRGGTRLLDDRPDLQESVELAAKAVDPLNHLQLELLSRRRRGDEDEELRLAIQLTVAGVAAGLRNTG
ncbi:phosphoenolpyruvate carboxylase [Caulobacter mirabilis]|uniref:Phosphoenolpyruvate carboxylase n=1 Tax=Caulobacter mirabilis TaxID=69666 RepID=A0A2D2B0D7_9CAUL|nr:phosphoenolpyruvate carboxylase [Caulobacter mirabilis]ATQ43732.1 phosphoenolpyruvate carboxylase [Caulobacter mirabilis]